MAQKKRSIAARGRELVKAAEHLKAAGLDAVQATNVLHSQTNGLYGKLFPTRQDREAFSGSAEDKKLRAILESLPLPEADLPSGRLLFRLPKTLHARLMSEAEQEGVSLNQLLLSRVANGH